MKSFKVAEGHEKDLVYVRGNTKELGRLNESEAQVLIKNGDKRIEVTVSEATSETGAKKGKKTEPIIVETHE